MRLIYISQGNIPSKWAHTFQAMKMAEAFGKLVPDFRLVTQVHWSALLRRRFDYESWYGIRHPFRIVRVPVKSDPKGPIFEEVRYPDFDRRAVAYAARWRSDIVYTRSEPAAELAVRAGLATLLETHTYRSHWIFDRVCAMATHSALAAVITISEVLRDQLESGGVPRSKILVLPDAVDMGAFDALPPKGVLRQRLGLPADIPVAFYAGHLYANRGIEEILAAARRLPEVKFVLVGGWDKDVRERTEQACGLSNVRFTGFVSNRDMPSWLMTGDVLLMPYSRACATAEWMSPMKLFEYMASGVPIVASDLPALRLHLTDGVNAVLVSPDSGVALAAGIRRVLDAADRGRSLGEVARRDVAGFTWTKRAEAILRTFCAETGAK
jgi:glycosyltransferase involved in cell wall biosynthesis